MKMNTVKMKKINLPVSPPAIHWPDSTEKYMAEYHPTMELHVGIARGKATTGPVRLTRMPWLNFDNSPLSDNPVLRTPVNGFCLRVGRTCLIVYVDMLLRDPVRYYPVDCR